MHNIYAITVITAISFKMLARVHFIYLFFRERGLYKGQYKAGMSLIYIPFLFFAAVFLVTILFHNPKAFEC